MEALIRLRERMAIPDQRDKDKLSSVTYLKDTYPFVSRTVKQALFASSPTRFAPLRFAWISDAVV